MNNTIETTDFYLVSYLITQGLKIKGQKRAFGKVTFQFENNQTTGDLIDKYYGLESAVEPVAYSQSVKFVKRLLHNDIDYRYEDKENDVKPIAGAR